MKTKTKRFVPVLLLAVFAVFATGCTTETKYGHLLSETVIVPVIIALKLLECPVSTRSP